MLDPAAKAFVVAGVVGMIATLLVAAWAGAMHMSALSATGDAVRVMFALSVTFFVVGALVQVIRRM